MPLSLRYIAHALNGDVYGDCVRAPGPGHSAGDRSLSIKLTDDGEDVIVNTFSPRDDRLACLAYVRDKCGIQPKPKVERFTEADIERAVIMAAESRRPKANIVALYPYEDQDGTLLYQNVRFDPKDFRQRRPDGNGGWIWKLNGVRRVLYRWPELIKHPDATVFLCEGEKDVDRVASLDLCATTVQGGKWTDECVNALVGRHCWILEDNDGAGAKKASDAATRLHPVAASVKIVRFPSLPKGGDVSDWRGYRTKSQFGGLYFALERADLVRRRMTAHRMRDNLPDSPIAIAGQVIDLMNRKCVASIVDAIKRAEDHLKCEVGLVAFDTWAKAIAAGHGDESQAKDQNAALANLRRVLDKVNVHIATIGHTGKDEGRGERGSNAKLADVDLEVQISGDSIRSAFVKKANDQPEGLLTSFRLEAFEFGQDEDGDPFRTFIVSDEVISDAVAQTGKLSDQQQRAIEALAEVTLSHGVDLPPTDGMPAGLKTVTTDQWRAELYSRGVLDQTVKNPRARFFELRNRLATKHLIGVRDELVWLARSQS